ncbi:MAG TPA: DNA primase [Acetobacteraceae bacterium]|nr:DNA primase [Acetobacteraceae bacterium]
MALPPAFLEELRARTPLAAVIGRRVKLARSGRQWKGCCPFHGEKTPSFYVYDDHFHCFGCGAHGDAISFVMQAQGAGFMEAVEMLAAEAGLDVPKPTPEAAAAAQRRDDLHSVLAAVAARFRQQLHAPEGAAALAYLRGRGLSDASITAFGLGWAGEGRGALAAALAREGIGLDQLAEAGLLRPAEAGTPARELFWSRVMFPIRDARGRVISFGGRTLGDGQPKYVNGPETALFAKRRTLYALDLARDGARRGAAVVAVEGYIDAIALHQAGFAAAVAPLGTALTEEQVQALWQLSPAPVLCFDGDAAGARAALRAMEVALPLLAPDRTLRVAVLPQGEDPDTLIRRGGPPAFQAVLDAARPLVDALYRALREGIPDASPEARAGLRTRLEAAAARIGDRTLAAEYRRALLDRFFLPRTVRGVRGGAPRPLPGAPPRPLPAAAASDAERARCLTAILLRHPALLRDVEEAYGQLDLPPVLARLRHAVQDWADHVNVLDSAGLIDHLTSSGMRKEVEAVLSATPMPLPAEYVSPDIMPAEAEAGWWHLYGLMHRDRLEEEVAAASRAFAATADAVAARRLIALSEARLRLAGGEFGPEPEA